MADPDDRPRRACGRKIPRGLSAASRCDVCRRNDSRGRESSGRLFARTEPIDGLATPVAGPACRSPTGRLPRAVDAHRFSSVRTSPPSAPLSEPVSEYIEDIDDIDYIEYIDDR